MTELYRHIGEYTDVPAGDIGVGGREIGYLFGQYKRITNRYESGVLTGKGLGCGGAQVRPEATGYGAVFFAEEMLRDPRRRLRRQAGAWSPAPATSPSTPSRRPSSSAPRSSACSDSSGYIVDEKGIDVELLKRDQGGASAAGSTSTPSAAVRTPRSSPAVRSGRCPATSPCPAPPRTSSRATRRRDPGRERLLAGGRGRQHAHHPGGAARSSRTPACCSRPGKAANAGGVATSARWRCSRTPAVTRGPSSTPSSGCRRSCRTSTTAATRTAEEYGMPGNYVAGANIAGFRRVAEAMLALGLI